MRRASLKDGMKEQNVLRFMSMGGIDTDYAGPVIALDRESGPRIGDSREVVYGNEPCPRAVLFDMHQYYPHHRGPRKSFASHLVEVSHCDCVQIGPLGFELLKTDRLKTVPTIACADTICYDPSRR